MSHTARAPEEHHIAVTRTARYWTAGDTRNAGELWVVCHGYAQLAARFISRFGDIAGPERAIVAPEALNRFYVGDEPGPHGPDARVGATWMTREDRLNDIRDYIAYLDSLLTHLVATRSVPPRRIVALGFSQGTATAARWAAATSHLIHDVVLWAGGLPPELEPAPSLFRGARVTLVAGRTDTLVPTRSIAALSKRLHDAGLKHAVFQHGEGHRITAGALHSLLAVWDDPGV